MAPSCSLERNPQVFELRSYVKGMEYQSRLANMTTANKYKSKNIFLITLL